MSKATRIGIGMVFVVAVGVVIIRYLPMIGYDSDVTRIGQGRPAVVLVFENFAPPSMEAMELFNQIRRDYRDRLDFLVADSGTPRGQAFIAEHGLQVGQVVTFRADGTRVRADWLAGDADALRARLREELAL